MSSSRPGLVSPGSGEPPKQTRDPSFLSRSLFLWLIRPLLISYRRPIREDETPHLWAAFGSERYFETHGRQFLAGCSGGQRHRRLWRLVFFDLMPVTTVIGIAFCTVSGLMSTVGRSAALQYAVGALEEGNLDFSSLAGLVLMLSGIVLVEGLTTIWGKHLISDQLNVSIFAFLSSTIISKSASTPAGEDSPVNLLGNDVVRAIDNLRWVGMMFSAIGGISGGIVMLILILGPSSLIGLALSFGIMGLNVLLSNKSKQSEKENLAASDHRMNLLKEMVNTMSGVKFFAWEQSCLAQICEARDDECRKIRRFRAYQMLSVNIGKSSPVISCLGTFLFFSVVLGEPLRPAEIFAALVVFQSMRMSLISIPNNLTILQNLLLSLHRIEAFLGRPDFPSCDVLPDEAAELAELAFAECSPAGPGACGGAVAVAEAGKSRQAFVLRDVALAVAPGTLTAVLGPVGAGKTTLVRALLGALPLAGPGSRARTCRSVGLVPQRPVTLNATVRENVLMGRPCEAARLEEAVRCAQLSRDLELLPQGLDTLVGERGTTLSGGQQMRLTIARTIYGQPDLMVLDDPLAALDHVVGSAVLEAVQRYAKGAQGRRRAVVMALNQVHFIRSFDHAIWLEGGRVKAFGSPSDVIAELGLKVARDHGVVDDIGEDGGARAEEAHKGAIGPEQVTVSLGTTPTAARSPGRSSPAEAAKQNGPSSTVKAETLQQGLVKNAVYAAFLRAMGPRLTAVIVATLITSYGTMAFGDRWLAMWIRQDAAGAGTTGALYPAVYLAAALAHTVTMNAGSLLCAEAGMRASRTLHFDCLVRVLKAPMAWFEETPSGHMLSRFSTDLSVVDLQLTYNLDNSLQMLLAVAAMAVVIFLLVPVVMAAALAGTVLYYFQTVAIDRMNREVKRMRDRAMAPLQTNLNEVLGFAALLQIDAREGRLRRFFLERHFAFADRWSGHTFASFSLLNFGQLLTYYISFLFTAAATSTIFSTDSVDPASSGLAFAYCFLVPYFLGIMSMFFLMAKHSFTSLERLLELRSERVPAEAWPAGAAFAEEAPGFKGPGSGGGARLDFEKVDLRYRPGLPLALRGLSLTVSPGERLGIVGRTGSGKSSILVTLFRLVEPSGGRVLIDGSDTSELGLKQLRSSIGMIPQSPVLLSGTVRKNLDPFGEFEGRDGELDAALREAELSELTLGTEIGAGGSGLSAGECQLMSFARCLLRHTRLVVLDEPTASVDFETDRKLQALVRTAFKARTLLCIAHRLQSVIDFDRILVMDAGQQAALGAPRALLADHGSALSQIVDAGAKSAARSAAKAEITAARTPCCSFSLGARKLVSQLPGAGQLQQVFPVNALRAELERILESDGHPKGVP